MGKNGLSVPTRNGRLPGSLIIAAALIAAATVPIYVVSPCAADEPVAATTTPIPQPEWKTPLPKGNDKFIKLLRAVSGRDESEEMRNMLSGVTKVALNGETFELVREDSAVLRFPPGTALGDRVHNSLEKTRQDTDRYGDHLSELLTSLRAVSLKGNHVELERSGPHDLRVAIKGSKHKIPFKVKELRISRISLDLDESKGYPAIKNINGLDVVVTLGIDWHIVLKEFWRTKNDKGETTVTFGIITPLPKPIRFALGINEISHFSYTFHKKKEGTVVEQTASS